MEFTEEHAKLIKETHDVVIVSAGKVTEHHVTLYGNGQPGIVKDFLKFKTQIITAVSVLTGLFTVVCAIIRWWK